MRRFHARTAEDRPDRRRRRGDARHALPRSCSAITASCGRRAAKPRCRSSSARTSTSMLLDVRLPGISGFDVLRIVKENYSLVEVIMISAINEIETAVQAMKHGAYHYITKDFDYDELRSLVRNASERQDLNRQVLTLSAAGRRAERPRVHRRPQPADRATSSIWCSKVAKLSATVLILGESGTGKELLARLHPPRVGRRDAPFIAVNLAAIPHELVESTLFGHERGVVHRRASAAARQVRAGRRRHAVPRRDRRSAARAAGQAAARDPGGRDRAGRRHQADQDRLPADRGDQRRSREGGQGRALPRGPLLPHQRHPDQAAAAARAHRRPAGARAVLPASATDASSASSAGHRRFDAEDAGELLVAGQHPRAREPDRAARRGQRQGLHHRRGPAARVPLRPARLARRRPARPVRGGAATPSSAISSCARWRNAAGTSPPPPRTWASR